MPMAGQDAEKETPEKIPEREPESGEDSSSVPGKGHEENEERKLKEKSEAEAGEHKGEEEGNEDKHTGRSIALMMLIAVIFGMVIFGMTQVEDKHVRNHTIMVLDNVIAIFLAVLWFQAFDDLLNEYIHEHYHGLSSAIHCLVWIVMSFTVAFALRQYQVGLAIFCGCGGHFVSFASIHAVVSAQEHYFSHHIVMCTIGFFILLGAFVLLLVMQHCIKKALGFTPGFKNDDESKNLFIERVDDMETDFIGMAMAMYWTLLVLFFIVGEYAEDEEIKPGSEAVHSKMQRIVMFFYSIWTVLFGTVVTTNLPKSESLSYWNNRLISFVKAFVTLCCAFAFLVWGKMEFYERNKWNVSPILARIIFAGVCSVVLVVGVFAVSWTRNLRGNLAATGKSVAVTALGLLAGLSWEETFDAACELAAEDLSHSSTLKVSCAVGTAAIILPIYLNYLKPFSTKAQTEEEEG